MSNVFSQLHPSLQDSLSDKGWAATPIQEMSIPEIIEGKDRILIAPTGSGKTLSAVLPIIHRCLDENWEPLAILYITPLRALNRDIDRRLHDIAESVGLKVGILTEDLYAVCLLIVVASAFLPAILLHDRAAEWE